MAIPSGEDSLDQDPSLPTTMRNFVVIWFGQLISMLGSNLTGFALGVWIYSQTGQATPFALTVLFGSVPRILLLPIGGSLADRWNRRKLMILTDTGSALLTLSVVLLLRYGDLQIYHIYLIATLGSVFGAFQEPAHSASVTMLVPKKDLARANGLLQLGQALTSMATPLLAGVLFVSIGLRGILWIDFITYFFAIGALFLIPIPQPVVTSQPEKERGRLWRDAAFGWQYLRQRPGLFGLLWYFALVNLLLNWSAVLIGPLVLSRYPASVLGVLQTVMGVGMLVGSLVMSSMRGLKRHIPAVILFISLAMLGLILMGIQPYPAVIGVGMFIMMFFIPLASANSQVVFQKKVAPDVQGRVFSIRAMIAQSMMPLAFLTAGPLADKVFGPMMSESGLLAGTLGKVLGVGPGRGIGLMLVISGLSTLLISGFVFANKRIRLVEDELPDAVVQAQPEAIHEEKKNVAVGESAGLN
jgi:DHA3 family macrolide efflux protein-like MFS transporter